MTIEDIQAVALRWRKSESIFLVHLAEALLVADDIYAERIMVAFPREWMEALSEGGQ